MPKLPQGFFLIFLIKNSTAGKFVIGRQLQRHLTCIHLLKIKGFITLIDVPKNGSCFD